MTIREHQDTRASATRLPGELNTDYRERMARAQADAAEARRRELNQQASTVNTPDRRIRIWEHLHAVPLPRTDNHPLLAVVANQTGLTLEQVQNEQRKRQA